jgi:hypothetical protein
MNIITIKTVMHMHIQCKCFNLIYHWILICNGKKIKIKIKTWFTNWHWWIIIFFPNMNFRIHNLKLKTWNNSCEFFFQMQLQWDTTSPIHLKNDTKQNKDKKNYNKNEYKQNTTNGENYLLMGTPIRLLQVETKICHHGPSTMPQYSSWTFAITFKDLTNNHYKWLL